MTLGLQDTLQLRDLKLQTTRDYALSVIDTNRECFMAQWVLQNQDKKIANYTMCYQYCGDVIKFGWRKRSDL